MTLLLAIFSLVVVVAVLTLARRKVRRHRLRRMWRELAPKLELSLTAGERLSGRYRGAPLEVVLSGQASQIRMAIQGEMPSGLHLSHQHASARRLRGIRDIQVGDQPLDDTVLVQAVHPAATIRLLREPPVRGALLELLKEQPQAVVSGNEVVIPLEKKLDEALIRRLLHSQQRLASALEDAASRFSELARSARDQARSEFPSRPGPSPAQMAPIEPSQRAIREEFARRRALYGIVTYPATLIGGGMILIATLVGSKVLELDIFPSVWEFRGFCVLFLGVLGGLITGHFFMRCPACGSSLSTDDEGLRFETEVCPECQTRLS